MPEPRAPEPREPESRERLEIHTVDYHTAGEPFRIVTTGTPALDGADVRSRRESAQGSEQAEAIRKMLCHEPRGHADMYGCFVVPPDDDGADFGAVFWHKDGYSTACGHGTIALGRWAVETGRVAADPSGTTAVVIDVPSGRVTATVTTAVTTDGGRVSGVEFRSVASYVLGRDVRVQTRMGEVSVDVSYGGAIYASVAAGRLGLSVEPAYYTELIAAGREVKHALQSTRWADHPTDPRLSGIYGTILYDDLGDRVPGGGATGPHQRNVTVFADGEVDRSPCGSGTAARVALLHDDGLLGRGRILTHDSIIGTRFLARVTEQTIEAGTSEAGTTSKAGIRAVVPLVEGMAHPTGEHRFVLESDDPLRSGFVLR